jgi:hypothetical protein
VDSEHSRTVRHRAVSRALAGWTDEHLIGALASSTHTDSGIGGSTARLEVDGVPVFVKLVALTHLENRPDNIRCTGNLFHLPAWYQFGVGSAGFGAWRELRAHEWASAQVLDGTCARFPLLHHCRILPVPLATTTPVADAIEKSVRFWDNSPAVRRRLRALAQAPATLVLALEFLPHTLHEWLGAQLAGPDDHAAVACATVETQLLDAVHCLREQGMSHFDAHFQNVLTDGSNLVVSDFGLSTSRHFDLNPAELRFFDHTAHHDLAYVLTHLANTIVSCRAIAQGPVARNAYLRRCAETGATPGLPAALADIVRRHAPVAAVMNEFYFRLHGGNPTTPYPAEEVDRALAIGGHLA